MFSRRVGSRFNRGRIPSGRRAAAPSPPIAGAVLWLRADLGVTDVGGHASVWADQSGTGDSNKNATQGTAGLRPTINSANSSYNNRATLDFDSGDQMVTGTWSSALSQPHTVFLVGNHGVAGLFYHALDSLDAASYIYGLFGNTYMNAGSDLADAVDTTSPQVAAAVFNGASSKLFVSKLTPVTGAAGAGGVTGLSIGADSVGSNNWGGPIAEVIAYGSALSDGDVATVLTSLGARYGITIGA